MVTSTLENAEAVYATACRDRLLRNASLNNELRESVEDVLKRCNEAEGNLIRLRYGLDGGGCRPMAEICEFLQIKMEAARRLEAKAIRKMRF